MKENTNLHKETTELRKYYETLQIDLISLLDEVELPEIEEKLSIDNFNDYIVKLQKFFEIISREKEQNNLSDRKKRTICLLKDAFNQFKLPEIPEYVIEF